MKNIIVYNIFVSILIFYARYSFANIHIYFFKKNKMLKYLALYDRTPPICSEPALALVFSSKLIACIFCFWHAKDIFLLQDSKATSVSVLLLKSCARVLNNMYLYMNFIIWRNPAKDVWKLLVVYVLSFSNLAIAGWNNKVSWC